MEEVRSGGYKLEMQMRLTSQDLIYQDDGQVIVFYKREDYLMAFCKPSLLLLLLKFQPLQQGAIAYNSQEFKSEQTIGPLVNPMISEMQNCNGYLVLAFFFLSHCDVYGFEMGEPHDFKLYNVFISFMSRKWLKPVTKLHQFLFFYTWGPLNCKYTPVFPLSFLSDEFEHLFFFFICS